MKAGSLDQRITIESPGETQDENGEMVPGWTLVATVWASVVDISGREFVAAGAIQNKAQTKVVIRFRDGILPAMRVLHRGIAYNIEAVLGQDRVELLLMCSRIAQ